MWILGLIWEIKQFKSVIPWIELFEFPDPFEKFKQLNSGNWIIWISGILEWVREFNYLKSMIPWCELFELLELFELSNGSENSNSSKTGICFHICETKWTLKDPLPYTYIYTYVCMYVYTRLYLYTCTYTRIRTHTHPSLYMCVCVFSCSLPVHIDTFPLFLSLSRYIHKRYLFVYMYLLCTLYILCITRVHIWHR